MTHKLLTRDASDAVASFETLLTVLKRVADIADDELTELVELTRAYLSELSDTERIEAITAMRARAAGAGDAGARACALVGVALPASPDALDALVGGVAAGVLAELADADGPEADALLDTLLDQIAQMPGAMAERYRNLLVEHKLARAAFVDDELKRRRNGRTPDANDARPAPTRPAFRMTDLGNAERLVALHGKDLRYCHAWGAWLAWDGTRWVKDDTEAVSRLARDAVRAMYREAGELESTEARRELARWAMSSESRYRLRAMVELAQAEAGVPVRHTDLDSDPWLLNCTNGTLDLRTGELREHRRADLITKCVAVDFDENATCPRWIRFLLDVLPDAELRAFVQRAVGYSLTGVTTEHALFFAHGGGRNGKSTFFEVILALLADYGQKMPTETLMMSNRSAGAASPDVARLPGARLVVAAEVDEGRRLAESLVKDLTGGDTLVARKLHQDYFEFNATHKLWLYGNHKPVVRGTDDGIWRRIHLIPFTVKIPRERVDPKLPEKLKDELPGILAWAVRGCLAWQEHGLRAPKAVQDATSAYRDEMDVLSAFLSECCVISDDATARAGELYRAYSAWCDANGERKLSGTAFGRRMAERFYKDKDMYGWRYRGLGLLASELES